MERILLAAAIGLFLSPAHAEAKGCIKGAMVGGLAGHAMGHGVLGAAAGCAVGRHEANKAEKKKTDASQQPNK